jgi:hypothetical protein
LPGLGAPWVLCPSTTAPVTVREWLTWTAATGLDGVLFKPLGSVYSPGVRGAGKKYKPARPQRPSWAPSPVL